MYKKDLTILSHFPIDFITLNTPKSSFANLTTQNELAEAWLSLIPGFSTSHVHVLPSIQHASHAVIARTKEVARCSHLWELASSQQCH